MLLTICMILTQVLIRAGRCYEPHRKSNTRSMRQPPVLPLGEGVTAENKMGGINPLLQLQNMSRNKKNQVFPLDLPRFNLFLFSPMTFIYICYLHYYPSIHCHHHNKHNHHSTGRGGGDPRGKEKSTSI